MTRISDCDLRNKHKLSTFYLLIYILSRKAVKLETKTEWVHLKFRVHGVHDKQNYFTLASNNHRRWISGNKTATYGKVVLQVRRLKKKKIKKKNNWHHQWPQERGGLPGNLDAKFFVRPRCNIFVRNHCQSRRKFHGELLDKRSSLRINTI